jgi:hypothetical protein
MQEVQLVISILEHPELSKFLRADKRAEHACIVKLGTKAIGTIFRDKKQKWRWVINDTESTESEPFDRRIEAALELVEYLHEEVSDRDVLKYESNGLRVVLHGSQFLCTGCGEWVSGSATGLRRIRPNLIRSQAQCHRCRSQ